MKSTHNLIKFSLLAPLALAVAACGGDAGEGVVGEPIDPIAAPDGAQWGDTVTTTEEGGYVIGNPDAPLKLIEYASHTCPACANFAITGKPGVKAYVETGIVSFEQREVFLNTFDVVIAGLAQCGPDELYQPLSDEVWQNLGQVREGFGANPQALQAAGELELDQRFVAIGEATGLIDFFAARGVSADQGRACLGDGAAMEALVNSVSAQSNEDNVTGTPTFFLNGTRVDGITWEAVEGALNRAGAAPIE